MRFLREFWWPESFRAALTVTLRLAGRNASRPRHASSAVAERQALEPSAGPGAKKHSVGAGRTGLVLTSRDPREAKQRGNASEGFSLRRRQPIRLVTSRGAPWCTTRARPWQRQSTASRNRERSGRENRHAPAPVASDSPDVQFRQGFQRSTANAVRCCPGRIIRATAARVTCVYAATLRCEMWPLGSVAYCRASGRGLPRPAFASHPRLAGGSSMSPASESQHLPVPSRVSLWQSH